MSKSLTLVFKIVSDRQQTELLAQSGWVANSHSDAIQERDALQRRAQQLQDRVQELEEAARSWKTKGKHRADVLRERIEALQDQISGERDETKALHSYIDKLEAQLDAVGAGGVEPLRRGQCLHQIVEPLAMAHPDDAAVDALAVLMKAKLAKQREKGYGGWETPECTQHRLSTLLRDHVDKGDPVDVANFCAFLSARGEGIAPQLSASSKYPVQTHGVESLPAMAREIFHNCYPAETQKAVDEVIEWLAASIRVEMDKAQPPTPVQEPDPFPHDEDLLEQLYWDFDHESSKGGQDRLTFKAKLRHYAQHVAPRPSAPPAPEEDAGRSDKEIVQQTEDLARFLLHWRCNLLPENETIQIRHSKNVLAQRCWAAACGIQQMLTATDVDDALDNLESQTGSAAA